MNSDTPTPIKRLNSNEVIMSPAKAIQRLENIMHKYGRDRALKSDSFQKARESWISGVFLLGYSKLTKQQWSLQENPIKHEDPDIFAYSYRDPNFKGEIGVVKEQILLEICEYPIYSKLNLVDHIKDKLKDKYYHPETWLVCYVQRPGEAFRIIDLVEGLHGLSLSVREVWILYQADYQTPTEFHIARIYMRGMSVEQTPVIEKGDYKILAQVPQAEFIQDRRGMDKTVTIRLGEAVIVPLPEDHISKATKS